MNRCTDEIKPFVPALSRLSAKDGVYSVLGNHDYGDYMDWKSQSDHERNNAEMRSIQARMGWTMLNNDHCFLKADNDSIVLIGVENWGEPPFRQYGRLEDAYPSIAAPAQNANAGSSRFCSRTIRNIGDWKFQETPTLTLLFPGIHMQCSSSYPPRTGVGLRRNTDMSNGEECMKQRLLTAVLHAYTSTSVPGKSGCHIASVPIQK